MHGLVDQNAAIMQVSARDGMFLFDQMKYEL